MKLRIITLPLTLIISLMLTACSSGTSDITPNIDSNTSPSPTQSTETPSGIHTPPDTASISPDGLSFDVTYQNAILRRTITGTMYAQLVIEITNTGNTSLALGNCNYDIEDESGKLLRSDYFSYGYPRIVLPGGKAYYYGDTIVDAVDETIPITILPRLDVKSTSDVGIELAISDIDFSTDSSGGYNLLGRVENLSSNDCSSPCITIVFYNSDDIPIALQSTHLRELLTASEKIGFQMQGISLPGDIKPSDIAYYEIFGFSM